MNEHENANRLAKANRIVAYCRDFHLAGRGPLLAADVKTLDDDGRASLCALAKVTEASPLTWAVVIEMLEAIENYAPVGDPLADLPKGPRG